MDPISKALERAEADETSTRQWLRPGQSNAPDANAAQQHGGRPKPSKLEGTDISLNLDFLSKNHVLTDSRRDQPIIVDRYRVLRTRTTQLMTANKYNTVGITSPAPKAGKTLTAINLAISLAREDARPIYLVDADLRQPALAKRLGINNDFGILDYLTGAVSLNDILLNLTDYPRLSLIPGREAEPEAQAQAPDLLQSRLMKLLLAELELMDENVIVIVDLPPALIGDDVLAVTSQLDAALLVIESGGTEIDEINSTIDLLGDVDLLGTILNKSTETVGEYGGYYSTFKQD